MVERGEKGISTSLRRGQEGANVSKEDKECEKIK